MDSTAACLSLADDGMRSQISAAFIGASNLHGVKADNEDEDPDFAKEIWKQNNKGLSFNY